MKNQRFYFKVDMLRKHSQAALSSKVFNCLLIQIANQPTTWQQLSAFRRAEAVLKF